jgi:sulfur carrier protein
MDVVIISVNNKSLNVGDAISVRDLLDQLGYNVKSVAVAVNGMFVARANHADTKLKENDKLDIVAPMQGG